MKIVDDMGMKEILSGMLATHCALDYDDLSCGNCTKEIDCADCLANDILKLLEIDQFGKWIPVTERLPEEDCKVVLVCGSRKGIYTAEFRRKEKHTWFHKLNSKCHHCEPTHWMPLPLPPKDGE